MNPLAFAVHLRRPEFGMHAENTAAMDWFVIATLCFLFFLLGCFAAAAWQIWRRTTRPEPHVQLLMELEEEQRQQQASAAASSAEKAADPWTKPADWWKS